MLYEKTISNCIRATAKRAKNYEYGRSPFVCVGLYCDKCPFDKNCRESCNFHTVQEWIEVLQEKGVTVDPALVAEYCNTDAPTVLTDTIKYLEQQYRYIEETIEDEILRDHSIKYLNKASAALHNALKYLSTADLMLRKQRGDQL
nr:MAG TPA: hypothetical protein [Caudoviricetes sp.]